MELDLELEGINREYEELEKLLVEYALPLKNIEKDLRETEKEHIKK